MGRRVRTAPVPLLAGPLVRGLLSRPLRSVSGPGLVLMLLAGQVPMLGLFPVGPAAPLATLLLVAPVARVTSVLVALLGLLWLPRSRPASLIAVLASLLGPAPRLLLAVARGLPATPLLALAVAALPAPLTVAALLPIRCLLSVTVALSAARLPGDQFAPVRVVDGPLFAVPVCGTAVPAAAGRPLGVQLPDRLPGLVVPALLVLSLAGLVSTT